FFFFFFQAEDGIRDLTVTGVQTCALPILPPHLSEIYIIVRTNAAFDSFFLAQRVVLKTRSQKLLIALAASEGGWRLPTAGATRRSEERRVGKECRSRWSQNR